MARSVGSSAEGVWRLGCDYGRDSATRVPPVLPPLAGHSLACRRWPQHPQATASKSPLGGTGRRSRGWVQAWARAALACCILVVMSQVGGGCDGHHDGEPAALEVVRDIDVLEAIARKPGFLAEQVPACNADYSSMESTLLVVSHRLASSLGVEKTRHAYPPEPSGPPPSSAGSDAAIRWLNCLAEAGRIELVRPVLVGFLLAHDGQVVASAAALLAQRVPRWQTTVSGYMDKLGLGTDDFQLAVAQVLRGTLATEDAVRLAGAAIRSRWSRVQLAAVRVLLEWESVPPMDEAVHTQLRMLANGTDVSAALASAELLVRWHGWTELLEGVYVRAAVAPEEATRVDLLESVARVKTLPEGVWRKVLGLVEDRRQMTTFDETGDSLGYLAARAVARHAVHRTELLLTAHARAQPRESVLLELALEDVEPALDGAGLLQLVGKATALDDCGAHAWAWRLLLGRSAEPTLQAARVEEVGRCASSVARAIIDADTEGVLLARILRTRGRVPLREEIVNQLVTDMEQLAKRRKIVGGVLREPASLEPSAVRRLTDAITHLEQLSAGKR